MTKPENGAATIERDLEALETALARGSADSEDPAARQLQELALALRAEAPVPDAAFADDLRGRVAAGFPEPARPRRLPALRRLVPALAAVAAVALPLVIAVSLSSGPSDEDHAGSGGGGAAEVAPQDGDGSVAAPEASSRSRFAPGPRQRRIERTFSLELDTPVDRIGRVGEDVAEVTGRYGGFVLSSSLNSGREDGGGVFELRIPSNRLRPALRALGGLAPVISQSQDGRDITPAYVTAQDRLQAARAERRGLLGRLETAATDTEAEAIRLRLDLVAAEINGLRGRLRALRLRTDYAAVTVTLVAESDDGQGGATGSIEDAFGDAEDLLVAATGVLIRVLASGPSARPDRAAGRARREAAAPPQARVGARVAVTQD